MIFNFISTANRTINDSAFCAMLDKPAQFPLWEVSFAVFFAIPMLIMLILYGRMGLKIRSRTRHTVALGECFNNNIETSMSRNVFDNYILFLTKQEFNKALSMESQSKHSQGEQSLGCLVRFFFSTIQLSINFMSKP